MLIDTHTAKETHFSDFILKELRKNDNKSETALPQC